MFKYSALIASCLFQVPHGNIREFILEKKINRTDKFRIQVTLNWGCWCWLVLNRISSFSLGSLGSDPSSGFQEEYSTGKKGGAPKEAPKDGEEKKGQPGRDCNIACVTRWCQLSPLTPSILTIFLVQLFWVGVFPVSCTVRIGTSVTTLCETCNTWFPMSGKFFESNAASGAPT